jgi:hypothetical protein
MRAGVLVLAMACLPSIGGAVERCPWLNAATAGGVLGGAVTDVTVKRAQAGDDASCDFVRHEGSLVLELRVETETLGSSAKDFASYAARCRSDVVPLKAIGNEALACSNNEIGDGRLGEQVMGRVRERAFLVRISTNDGSAQRSELRDKARKVAEMVAGFLF